jgi:hypothetical protein
VAKKKVSSEEPKNKLHVPEVVDPRRWNNRLQAQYKIVVPCNVLEIKHDPENPYYTQLKVLTTEGERWIGQSWFTWEGKTIV